MRLDLEIQVLQFCICFAQLFFVDLNFQSVKLTAHLIKLLCQNRKFIFPFRDRKNNALLSVFEFIPEVSVSVGVMICLHTNARTTRATKKIKIKMTELYTVYCVRFFNIFSGVRYRASEKFPLSDSDVIKRRSEEYSEESEI